MKAVWISVGVVLAMGVAALAQPRSGPPTKHKVEAAARRMVYLKAQLAKLVKDYPGTPSAKEAEDMLGGVVGVQMADPNHKGPIYNPALPSNPGPKSVYMPGRGWAHTQ